jgi:hypothetical protein
LTSVLDGGEWSASRLALPPGLPNFLTS